MKYAFIINPIAGKANPLEKYGPAIRAACKSKGLDYVLYQTERPGHATDIAKWLALHATPEHPVRVFSVGGDGTLSEVVKGLVAREHCELGCIPCGSGNDYAKSFGAVDAFLDMETYILSDSVPVDVIKAGDQISINICSMGFDAIICNEANQIKAEKKKLSGSAAYNRAVLKCLFGKIYNDLKVTIDDDEVFEGQYVFSIAASGQYYGGGFNAAPMADPGDGLLDFILIKRVSHLKVLTLIGDYKAGKHVSSKKFKKILTVRRGRKMTIEAKNSAILNVDGECQAVDRIDLEVAPAAIKFIVPAK